ncbi:hypothetical protein [Rhizobium yanglingense]
MQMSPRALKRLAGSEEVEVTRQARLVTRDRTEKERPDGVGPSLQSLNGFVSLHEGSVARRRLYFRVLHLFPEIIHRFRLW